MGDLDLAIEIKARRGDVFGHHLTPMTAKLTEKLSDIPDATGARRKSGLEATNPMWLVARFAVVALVAGCVRNDSTAPDASSPPGPAGAAGVTGSLGFTVSNRDPSPPIPPPPTVPSDEVEFPDPPEIACTTDTGGVDAGGCAFPQPVCGRIACDLGNCGPQANGWSAYYTNPRCVDNRCRWDRRFMWCSQGCSRGGCIFVGTLP